MTDGLDLAVDAAVARYVDRHPNSREQAATAAVVLPGGNTRSVLHIEPFAFRVAGATGARITDVDGHTYLDLLGDYSAGLIGRSSVVAGVVRDVLERGWSFGAISEAETLFAEAVVARFPSIDQVRFTNSGSEANVLALMTARHVTGRPRVVVFDGAYHGGPLYFGPGGEGLRIPFEYAVVPYNDVAALEAELNGNGDRVAAVLVEPMLGAGGCIPGRPEFLAAARELTSTAGALLIFDEVMTSRLAVGGVQRPARNHAGHDHARQVPRRRALVRRLRRPARRHGRLRPGGRRRPGPRRDVQQQRVHHGRWRRRGEAGRRRRRWRRSTNAASGCAERSTVASSGRRWPSRRRAGARCCRSIPSRGPVERPADLAGADPRWRHLLFHELLAAGYYIAPRGYLALTMDVSDDDLDGFIDAVDNFLERYAQLA